MNIRKVPALLLAVGIQIFPICRVALVNQAAAPSGFAIVMRWMAGAVALLGSYHAVSGASATLSGLAPYSAVGGAQTGPVTVNLTGVVGQPFVYRYIIVGQTGSDIQQDIYLATPMPPGLRITNYIVGSTGSGYLIGTPTTAGVTSPVTFSADNANCHCPQTKIGSITITGGAGGTAPSITTQPQSLTVSSGASASFSVVATGDAPLTYQWVKGTANISGATSSSYTIPAVAASDAANYTVVVGNSVGSVTSSVATLTVLLPPSILTPPQSLTVNSGASASFSVTATGTAPLTYQWVKGTANITGATSSTYTIPSVSASDAASYSVVVGNAAGSVTSASATLTVVVPPSITAQPQSLTVNSGASASFSVTATGTGPLTYQWVKGTANITGATSSTYTIPSVSASDAASYSVVVGNAAGSVTSSSATLTVVAPPAITAQPQSLTANSGASASFSVTATGTAPLTYQWVKGTANITGATSSTYTIPSVSASDAASYSVVVGNAAGSVTSSSATLTVVVPPCDHRPAAEPDGQ